ncbi:hypothetical protein [Mucisphaera calidilacus]|uniref:TonB C-terminal domain-containing protein n=1 Tax=Mucisphaera calidilacus TaxID=2527982 RepID=A0A518BZW8_9BACT|nr:hypothetical protein [Mucisphaera calidilacus]QDU72499.1 hypothetical protein Pan265_23650 [Mucisphaera calidilacus]
MSVLARPTASQDFGTFGVTLILSVLLHLLIIMGMYQDASVVLERDTLRPRDQKTRIEPGDTPPSTARVAWIAREDYQAIMARQSTTEQPALQATADPTPDAQANPLPTSPENNTPSDQTTPLSQSVPVPPTDQTAQPEASGDTLPRNEQTPLPEPAPPQNTPPSSTATAGEPGPENPTSLPKDEREAPPTRIEREIAVKPGNRVEARQGLVIQTRLPRFTVAARAVLPQRNPVVIITFNTDGQVIHVDWIRKSGHALHDSPIESSLYQWEASGPLLERAESPIEVEMKILLLRESRGSSED